MVPSKDKSPEPRIAEEGDVVRLTAVNGPYYSFIGFVKRDDRLYFHRPDYYLLHESEFFITWTRSGPPTGGGACGELDGEDLEANWFMYADALEEDGDMEEVDDPEPAAFCEACDGHYPKGRGHVFWFADPIERDGRRFYSACRACIEHGEIQH